MNVAIDFSKCPRVPGRAYNGANGKKIAVCYDHSVWMLKFPPSAAERPNELSYSNSCLSEHIASTISNIIGVKAQDTCLGVFVVGEKTRVVCACRDFTDGGKVFYDFCSVKNTVIDSDTNGTGTDLDDVLDTIDKQTFVEPVALRDFFWDMFVVDALLGNFDRHNGNWGFLVDANTRQVEVAPLFDFGSCLLPQADEKIMRRILDDKAEMDARIHLFPMSALKKNGRKISYVDFVQTNRLGVLERSIAKIVPRIDLQVIFNFIDQVSLLTELQREFYKRYIQARYEALFVSR
jgi:hypothetical protein